MTETPSPLARLLWGVRWLGLLILVMVAVGLAGGLFLKSLTAVTDLFHRHHSLIFTLPVMGFASVWLYQRCGGRSQLGIRLLVAEIKSPQERLPATMAPLIFSTTLLSHLGGASVGREGTALQLGGSLADQFSRGLALSPRERQTLLLCGVSAGFAAVFGTPMAAAIFALEFVKLRSWQILPCLICAWGADYVGQHWVRAQHWDYHVHFPFSVNYTWGGIFGAAILGVAAAFVARLYLHLVRWPMRNLSDYPNPYFRVLIASLIFGILVIPLGIYEFTGLGLPLIDQAFCLSMPLGVWSLKLFLTVLCVGLGFRGGEVTPLFFIGATLGSALSLWLPLPLVVGTGLGFVAVFAGAGRVPIACAVMAAEAFEPSLLGYALITCIVSAWIAGPDGLYDESEVKP